MADENWQQVRKIFDEALRQKPEERQTFVRRACGKNKTLRGEVESLLKSLDSAESFLEQPAIAKVVEEIATHNRQFNKGQTLNHYKIIKQIGTGGMGEVYLAKDTKLNRKVALKILRETILADSQSNRRLLREAQAAALLEHPNICAIYEISEADEFSFIVMQYIEGKTLAEMLADEHLTAQNSLDLGIQIADALTEAHSRGIIHRDIKPANIIVNEKGQVKVLDFGLAMLVRSEEWGSKEKNSTLEASSSLLIPYSSPSTPGAVMGTVPFMSPEQLCGKRLDARTDIFSFGAMFYEMLTGKSAFAGESNAETISAILNDEPDLSDIPDVLQPIVRQCLSKKSLERYQTVQKLKDALLEVKQSGKLLTERKKSKPLPTAKIEQNSTPENARPLSKSPFNYFWKSSEQKVHGAPETTRIGAEQTVETKLSGLNWATVLLSTVIVLFSIGAGFLIYLQFYKTDDLHSFDNLRSVRLTSWKTAGGTFYSDYRVSHDGKMVAYSAAQQGLTQSIYVKQTADGAEIRVTKDEWSSTTPIWSPDDRRIAFVANREGKNGIYSIPAFGGVAAPVKVIGDNDDVRLRHWAKDGTAIFYELDGNLFRLEIATQETTQLTNFAPERGAVKYFGFSPDEEKIVYVDKTDGQSDLWMSAIKNVSPVRLTNDKDAETQLRFHPDGERILYTVQRNNYDQINVAYTDASTPRQVTRGESEYRLIDVSGNDIYYLSKENEADIFSVRTETGEEFETAANVEAEFWSDVSPDSNAIAYQTILTAQTFSPSGDLAIVIKSLTNQFPTLSVKGYNPRWLPDNRRVAFLRWNPAEKKVELWLVNAVTGEEKLISTNASNISGYSFLPYNRNQTREFSFSSDSRRIIFVGRDSGVGNIFSVSSDAGEIIKLTDNTNQNLSYRCPLFSPDGKRIMFMTWQNPAAKDEKMIYKIWVLEKLEAKEIYSTTAILRPLGWTADDEIILEKSTAMMPANPSDITLLRISTTGLKRSERVFKNIYGTSMSLSAGGKTLVFTVRQDDKDNIFIAAANGGEMKKITSNGNSKLFYGSPVISTDGKTIFFDKQEETNIISRLENFK